MVIIFPALLLVFLLGCSMSSEYHIGVHYLGSKEAYAGVVSKQVNEVTQPFEELCIESLTRNDMVTFKGLFTDLAFQNIQAGSFDKLKGVIRNTYKFNGQYERLKRVTTGWGGHDEAHYRDTFAYYDFVEVVYRLYGESDAVVHLYITAVQKNLRLSGFAVYDADPINNERKLSVQYLFPETIDRADIRHRYLKDSTKMGSGSFPGEK